MWFIPIQGFSTHIACSLFCFNSLLLWVSNVGISSSFVAFSTQNKKKYQERKETNQNEQTRDYHKCEMGFQEKLYLFNLQPSRALIIPSFSTALHHNPDFFISSQKEVIFNDTKGLILNPTKLFNKFYVRHCKKKNFLLFQKTAAWDPIKLSRAGP